ncbi:MAG: VWA domain-containing protein [Deltaproteobacteria bacterium]|nr:VWA domain-containing protein [Deltaproteobacteria bacterium]
MLTAHRVRTSVAIAGAAGAIIAAALFTGRVEPPGVHPDDFADDGLQLTAKLPTQSVLAGAMEHDLAVMIVAPGRSETTRAPLSLVVVIDRSGSMAGDPLRDAKAAAGRLIEQLGSGDAFAIVTYSSTDETVMGMTRATEVSKRRALDAIETIMEEGGTCISCGLQRGTRELAASPIAGGLRRMVLISDGQANEGIYDRGELAQLASDTAQGGVSITSVGVGLDFDEVTMVRLANVGRGNYYFVENTGALDQIFSRELGGLAQTIGTNAKLILTDGLDARIVDAYGYPSERAGDHVIIPIADLRAGESRKVVLRVRVAPAHTGPLTIAKVELGWRRPTDGANRHAVTTAQVDVVDDPDAVADSVDVATVRIIEQARSAHALEEANGIYDSHGADAARQVLELRGAAIGANKYLDAATVDRLRRTNEAALETLRTAPASKAKKINAVQAYELAR